MSNTAQLTKQVDGLLGSGAWGEQQEGKRRSGLQPRVLSGDVVSFWGTLASLLTQGPSWWCTHCSAKDAGSDSGGGRLILVSL